MKGVYADIEKYKKAFDTICETANGGGVMRGENVNKSGNMLGIRMRRAGATTPEPVPEYP